MPHIDDPTGSDPDRVHDAARGPVEGEGELSVPIDLDDLDRIAPEVLTRGLPGRLIGVADWLLAADLDGHPWAQLLTAAVCHDVYRGDPRAAELVDAAWQRFDAEGDGQGQALSANVLANIALGQGDIAAAVSWWRRAGELLPEDDRLASSVAAHTSLDAYAAGDLATAIAAAREALVLAEGSGRPEDTVVPMVYLSMYAFCQGDLARAAQLTETADQQLRDLPEGRSRNDGALVSAFAGVVHAVRGNQAAADHAFTEALRRAERDDVPWYEMMARVLRADFTASWAPHRSLADARSGLAVAIAMGDEWWTGMARMALGSALAGTGDLRVAEATLREAVAELSNPLERGWAQLELGEVQLRSGDRNGARATLDEARAAFDVSGARYWAARAALTMGSADRDRGGRWLRLARATAADDPTYARLFAPVHELRIDVLGTPSITLDGESVSFITRHAELAVYLLALAGPVGLSCSDLAEALWPSVDERRAGPRLRTLLWQARNALGAEAWRVQRRGDRVYLDLDGVVVDVHTAALAMEEGSAAVATAGSDGSDVFDSARAARRDLDRGLLLGWDVTLPPSITTP